MTSVNASELKCLDGKSVWRSPSYAAVTDDGVKSEEGDEVLVAFTRVFSGTLRMTDIDAISSQDGTQSDGDYMYLLGPKYNPAESLTLERKDDLNNEYSVVVGESATAGHVTGITAKSQNVLSGITSFEMSSSMPTPSSSSEVMTSETTAMNKRKSPIALYMMMGDGFVPVSSVPAGSLCAIAGLDAFSTAKCMTLVVGPNWSVVCPPFKPLAMQVADILYLLNFCDCSLLLYVYRLDPY